MDQDNIVSQLSRKPQSVSEIVETLYPNDTYARKFAKRKKVRIVLNRMVEDNKLTRTLIKNAQGVSTYVYYIGRPKKPAMRLLAKDKKILSKVTDEFQSTSEINVKSFGRRRAQQNRPMVYKRLFALRQKGLVENRRNGRNQEWRLKV